jgi:hypothetical protein
MRVKFDDLWAAHPALSGDLNPCSTDEVPNFENQCAIRMGECLRGAGVSLGSFRGAKCWFQHTPRHILRAEELASWMAASVPVFGRVRKKKHVTVAEYEGRTGIVLCRNFWGTGMQGDHVDVWNGEAFAGGKPDYFERSQEVWFWELE